MKLQFGILLLSLLFIAGLANAQERVPTTTSPYATQVPADARFEVVQVFYLREPLLLKLDKHTGEVFELTRSRELVREKGQGNAWQLTKWFNRPLPEEIDAQKVNFQLFSTASTEGSAFLMNVHNGDVWILYREQTAEKDFTWVLTKTQKK